MRDSKSFFLYFKKIDLTTYFLKRLTKNPEQIFEFDSDIFLKIETEPEFSYCYVSISIGKIRKSLIKLMVR